MKGTDRGIGTYIWGYARPFEHEPRWEGQGSGSTRCGRLLKWDVHIAHGGCHQGTEHRGKQTQGEGVAFGVRVSWLMMHFHKLSHCCQAIHKWACMNTALVTHVQVQPTDKGYLFYSSFKHLTTSTASCRGLSIGSPCLKVAGEHLEC